MNTRYARTRSSIPTASELITAVENFVAKGGIIAVIPDGEVAGASNPSSTDTAPTARQPMLTTRRDARHDTTDIDDVVAGHAMHYSALGYTAAEIAQVLDLSLRQVWNIGKAYRFEFRQQRDSDTP
ncbi:hypothetical protein BKM09_005555 [Pseudomonas amygdali pv. morsprunorum]|nr:hypothetical protein [Pseudomonas amygdali]POY82082.1 hypothetical protein BKM09_005555 [Pseudomonas amygdali pv. morsprunorum]